MGSIPKSWGPCPLMLNHSFALFLVLTLWGVGCLKLKVTQQCTTKNITGLMRILSLITHIIVVWNG